MRITIHFMPMPGKLQVERLTLRVEEEKMTVPEALAAAMEFVHGNITAIGIEKIEIEDL